MITTLSRIDVVLLFIVLTGKKIAGSNAAALVYAHCNGKRAHKFSVDKDSMGDWEFFLKLQRCLW